MNTLKAPHPSWIEIDLKQFKKNIGIIRAHIGGSLYCLPVKANAYGHGLCAIGKAAEEAGVDYLGVAHLQEGIQLRQAGVKLPILVLGAIHEDQISELINYNMEFSISSKFKADLVASKCKEMNQSCRVHLEVDTGMQRTGVRYETALHLYEHIKTLGGVEVVGVYSHLATADSFADKQIEIFKALMQEPPFQGAKLIRHIANSGGVTHFSKSHLDMVRPSLMTFGYASDSFKEIAPCFSLKSKVSYFKVVEKGEGVSYGHSYYTTKRTRIVTIPIGYGDGFRRALSNRGSVLIRGKKYPIVGTICMDQFMVDAGDDEMYVGDEVVLIGKQGNEEILLTDIAKLCDTIPYEVLCLFNERLPRVYI
ncbi:MAG: alanine racemase [Rhabdochlamydiaceae bacterium]|jgi:alanine racemase